MARRIVRSLTPSIAAASRAVSNLAAGESSGSMSGVRSSTHSFIAGEASPLRITSARTWTGRKVSGNDLHAGIREQNIVGTLPEDDSPDFFQLLAPFNNRQEVIARQ